MAEHDLTAENLDPRTEHVAGSDDAVTQLVELSVALRKAELPPTSVRKTTTEVSNKDSLALAEVERASKLVRKHTRDIEELEAAIGKDHDDLERMIETLHKKGQDAKAAIDNELQEKFVALQKSLDFRVKDKNERIEVLKQSRAINIQTVRGYTESLEGMGEPE